LKNRQYITIILFVISSLGLSLYSWVGHRESDDSKNANAAAGATTSSESFFKFVEVYLVDKANPFLKLEATELMFSNSNTVLVGFNPDGVIYRRNERNIEEEPIFFKSKNSRMDTAAKQLNLDEEVSIEMGNTTLESKSAKITNNGALVEATTLVKTNTFDPKTNDKLNINSDYVLYRPKDQFFEYRNNVNGLVTRKREYEESVSFTTDLLTLYGLKSEVEMRGNVAFKKENLDAFANKGSVFLENYNKKLKYYALSDDVRLQERLILDGKPMTRKAFSEKLEGIISEKKIILTGLPKVFQDKDVIKGNRIIIRENIETVEVDDANTSITLEPEKAKE
jgi:lipopolysaccharide export system protein LptA